MNDTELVVGSAAGARRTVLTTLRKAAEFAGITPARPSRAANRPAPDQALEDVLATLQQADIAPIAIIIWGEAIRNPALSQRLSALYTHLGRPLH